MQVALPERVVDGRERRDRLAEGLGAEDVVQDDVRERCCRGVLLGLDLQVGPETFEIYPAQGCHAAHHVMQPGGSDDPGEAGDGGLHSRLTSQRTCQ